MELSNLHADMEGLEARLRRRPMTRFPFLDAFTRWMNWCCSRSHRVLLGQPTCHGPPQKQIAWCLATSAAPGGEQTVKSFNMTAAEFAAIADGE